jgi:hypothetical protein
MKRTLDVINAMEAESIFSRYAISGAMAAFYYIEPAVTDDLDVLISIEPGASQGGTGLVTLERLFAFLRARGYDEFRREGVVIEGWPVQFLPVATELDAEALAEAEDVDVTIDKAEGSVRTRILKAEHLAAIALRVGRPKDFIRITQFMEHAAIDPVVLCEVLARHGLVPAWRSFCRRFGLSDPCSSVAP